MSGDCVRGDGWMECVVEDGWMGGVCVRRMDEWGLCEGGWMDGVCGGGWMDG